MRTFLVVLGALVAVWLAFLLFVAIAKPDDTRLRDAVRLLPDVVRLVRRIVADPAIPRRTRWLVWALLAYLVVPIDLIPDFVPGLGYADDVIVTSLVLRYVIRRAGMAKVEERWPGTPEGLDALRRLLRLRAAERGRPTERNRRNPDETRPAPIIRVGVRRVGVVFGGVPSTATAGWRGWWVRRWSSG